MSLTIGAICSSTLGAGNRRNMSVPTLFAQNSSISSMSLSRDCLERVARSGNSQTTATTPLMGLSSPNHQRSKVKFVAERHADTNDIVTINVSGRRYQTYMSTLQRFPISLLGDPMKRKNFYNKHTQEYFFDRNRKAFGGILHYYQSQGEIECPSGVSEKNFAQELLYFELYEQTKDANTDTNSETFEVPQNKTLALMWVLFEKPNSSKGARVLAVFSISIILLSITVFCLETVPSMNPDLPEGEHMEQTWYLLNIVCSVWFTLELIFRFVAAPNKIAFIKSALNLIDFLSILPFYITQVVGHTSDHSLAVLRVIRVIRVIRIFKLTRHSRGLHILANTIKASFQELIMLVLFLAIAIILFSSAVYFAEASDHKPDNKFESIPHSFWWAVITMTTVGMYL